MTSYGLLLLGQTLLALLVLALCGGWALLPFRRDDRPCLWLGAPLAGLFTLGGVVAILYVICALPFGPCLWAGLAVNAAATAAVALRAKPVLPSRGQLAAAAAVALVATVWAAFVCNRTAIERGEPTLAYVHNNDMFNYAVIGDWVRAHRWADPPSHAPLDFIPQWHVKYEGGRPVTFALLAAASEVRGTSALFSFDWLTGVVLSAALAGFGGLFASNPLMLALLVAGAGVSSWPTECRTAYLGKSVAYPGAMMLGALALDVLSRGGRRRVAVVCALGAAIGFSLNPVFTPPVLGLVLGGYAGVTALGYAAGRWRGAEGVRPWPGAIRPVLAALLLWAAVALPAVAVHRMFFHFEAPPPPLAKWSIVIPVSLDLELPTIPAMLAGIRNWTLWGVLAVSVAAGALAVRQGNRAALALMACVLAIPAARLAGDYRLHSLQGILYPLTLAGAALLAGAAAPTRRVAAAAVVVALLVGLRVPQHLRAGDFYFYPDLSQPAVLRQSEVEAVRAAVAGEAVDVSLPDYPDNHLAMTELLGRGTRVQFQGLAWTRTLGVYLTRLEPHNLTAPKARFSLVEREQWAPPGSERWVGSRWKLIEDSRTVSVLSVGRPMEFIRFEPSQPGVWLGAAPAEVLIHNGTGRPAAARLHALLIQHPSRAGQPDVLHSRLDGEITSLVVANREVECELVLNLKPGLNRVSLWAEAGGSVPAAPGAPLLGFGEWRIEFDGAAPAKE
jgi:hypothetical protein